MTDLINQAKDLFSEEIDAFAGTYSDVKDMIEGKPVHTSAQKWAKRAITAATTVIPVGLAAKGALKGAKIGGKLAKASLHLTKEKRAAARAQSGVQQLRKERDSLRRAARTSRQVGKDIRRGTNAVYYASGDRDARARRNAVIYDVAVFAQNPQELKKMAAKKRKLISAKMRNDAIGGAADAAIKQLSARKYKKQPITADDMKVVGVQMALGALKGARGGKHATKKNDKHWYTKLGTDLVGLNFAAVDKLGYRDDILLSPLGNKDKIRVTTDAVISLKLTVPSGVNNPFTTATAKLANEMRLHSGANTIYTPTDLMEYLINGRSIMAGLCQLMRFVKTLNNADPTDVDAYKKYGLMAMCAFSSALGNLYNPSRRAAANLLTDLNASIKAVEMMIPINMPIMKRTEWLFSNAFADGKTSKNSTKMFVAPSLPVATIDNQENIQVTENDIFVEQLPSVLTRLQRRINEFVVQPKHMAIAGDIMKVYGKDAFWAPPLLTGTESMPILYDEEALTQIQNMTVVSSPCVKLKGVTQSIANGVTTTALTLQGTGQDENYRLGRAYARNQRKVVQTYKPNPDGGDVLELTRLTSYVGFDDPGSGTVTTNDVVCGTELVDYYGYVLERVDASNDDHLVLLKEDNVGNDATAMLFASCWAIDDWGPLVIIDYSPTTQEVVALFDFETWAAISKEQMSSYHYIAGVSLYTNEVPILRPTI